MTNAANALNTYQTPLKPLALWLFAGINAANGLYMFLAPTSWFFTAPGVLETGQLNIHFVQDVGSAYLTAAVAAALAATRPAQAFLLMAVGSVFVGLHGLIHVQDIALGRCGDPTDDILAVIIPSALWIGLTLWVRSDWRP